MQLENKPQPEDKISYKSKLSGKGLAGLTRDQAIERMYAVEKALDAQDLQHESETRAKAISMIPEATALLNHHDSRLSRAVIALLEGIAKNNLSQVDTHQATIRSDILNTFREIILNPQEDMLIKMRAKNSLSACSTPQEILLTAFMSPDGVTTKFYGGREVKHAKLELEQAVLTLRLKLKDNVFKDSPVNEIIPTINLFKNTVQNWSFLDERIINTSISAVPEIINLLKSHSDEQLTNSAILFFEVLGKKLSGSKDPTKQAVLSEMQETLRTIAGNSNETKDNQRLATNALQAIAEI